MTAPLPSLRHVLWLLLGLAFLLRLGVGLAWPNIHQADEVFQVLEPAHRLAFGYGIVSWEWRLGIRSWLLPGLLSPVLSGTAALGWGPVGYGAIVQAIMALLSLSVVAVGFALGARQYGRAGAIVVGTLCALWVEFVYFAPKTFTEVIAAHMLIIAVWLILAAPRRLVLIGLLLGLTGILRFHAGAMILVAAIWVCRADPRAWLRLAGGAALPVAAQAVLDWITLGTPLQSVWLNFWINVVAARSDIYGVAPFYWYPGRLLVSWGAALPLVLAAATLGARRAPLLGWMVLAHVAAHSLIGHKELRFLYPAMPPLLILAGLGVCRVLSRWPGFAAESPRLLALTIAAMGALSLATATGPGYSGNWTSMAGGLAGTDTLRERAEICGIGVLNGPDWKGYWTPTGGYYRLHRAIPLYPGADADALTALAPRFNAMSLPRPVGDKVTGFTRGPCRDFNVGATVEPDDPQWCVYIRPGGCVPDPAATINPALVKADQ